MSSSSAHRTHRNYSHSHSQSRSNAFPVDACSSASSTATAIYIDDTDCMDANLTATQLHAACSKEGITTTQSTIDISTTTSTTVHGSSCVSINIHPTNHNHNNNTATLSAVNTHHHHHHSQTQPHVPSPHAPAPHTPRTAYRGTGLFSDDYTHYISIPNLNLFRKLYSPHASDYYAMSQFKSLMSHDNHHHNKERRSDCPSDISSLDSRRRKKRQSRRRNNRLQRALSAITTANAIICSVITHTVRTIVWTCGKLQKWQKDVQEAPIETKEKYFFVASTLVSTLLFYLLFVCLDFMIKHWFALPQAITEFSFSISYCIAYLSSVIWQHFFNQYFVFALKVSTATSTDVLPLDAVNGNDFCDSLLRTYLVYGCSLLCTGVIGTALQARFGIADEFVFFITLPMSGVMNYYLLRYCHSRQSSSHGQNYRDYQLVPNSDHPRRQHQHRGERKKKSSRHSSEKKGSSRKHSKSASQIAYSKTKYYAKNTHTHHKHSSAADDIVIV